MVGVVIFLLQKNLNIANLKGGRGGDHENPRGHRKGVREMSTSLHKRGGGGGLKIGKILSTWLLNGPYAGLKKYVVCFHY